MNLVLFCTRGDRRLLNAAEYSPAVSVSARHAATPHRRHSLAAATGCRSSAVGPFNGCVSENGMPPRSSPVAGRVAAVEWRAGSDRRGRRVPRTRALGRCARSSWATTVAAPEVPAALYGVAKRVLAAVVFFSRPLWRRGRLFFRSCGDAARAARYAGARR